MADPYEILGIKKNATDGEVKSAYRRLAKKYHPDSNANNPSAQAKFSEATQAYEVLGDKPKRAQYDRGEIDEKGNPKGFSGNPFGGGGNPFGGGGGNPFGGATGGSFRPEDIFSEIFGGGRQGGGQARPARGNDINYTVRVDFTESALGTTRRVELSGGRKIDMKIPAGVTNLQVIRLKGQGESGARGGPSGDALVKVIVAPSPLFQRDGFNIKVDLPVSLYEAVLGATLRVPTLEGEVNLKIPPNSSSGKVMRLKGKGAGKDPVLKNRGDLLYTLKIILPKEPDDKLKKLMKEWKETNPYPSRGSEFGNNS